MKIVLRRVRRSALLVVAALFLGLMTFVVLLPAWRNTSVLVAAAGATFGALAIGAISARWISPRAATAIEAGGWAALVATVTWLAWDPAPTEPRDRLVPPPGVDAESSRTLYLQACKGGACEQWPEILAAGSLLASAGPSWKGSDFATLVAAESDAIEAAWDRAGPGRAWMAEVNALPAFSDHVETFASPILRFQVLRNLARVHGLRAGSLALQDRGDEALATLVPLAELSRHLRQGGRSLVTVMIATVLDGMVNEHACFVLEHSGPGPESRARLAAALERGATDGGDLARAVLCEAELGAATVTRDPAGVLAEIQPKKVAGIKTQRLLANPLVALVFNRHAFAADLHAYAMEMAELVRVGDAERLKRTEAAFVQRHGGIHLKNPAGHAFLSMMVPAYEKVTKTFHERLAQRRELAARLRETPPASVALTDSVTR